MRQVFISKGQALLANIPAPLIEPGHVLVEVAFSLISTGTELSSVQSSGQSLVNKALGQPEKIKKLWEHLRRQGIQKTVAKVQGQLDQATPTGYSCSGIVIQVGAGVTDIKPGDRVACSGSGIAYHAEIVLAPRNLLVKVPDECSLKDAASVTLGAIAMQGVRRADPRFGEIVAVIGLGLLGQITLQLLKVAGCQVIGLDLDNRRVALALKLGSDFAFNPAEQDITNQIRHLTGGYGVDATIITAASESDAIVQQAMVITRKKGRVVIVGAVGLGLKRSPFYEKEIDLLISCSYGPGRYDERYENKGADYPYAYVRWTENRNMQEYLRLIAEKKVNLTAILEREYPIDEAQQAYQELSTSAEKPLGIVLTYPIDLKHSQEEKRNTSVIFNPKPVNGKINVAIIGAGSFAKGMHLPNLKELSSLYHLRAVVDMKGSNAKATAEQFGADYASTDYHDVLADDRVDMVIITTRHNVHAQIAMEAARAGKAIFLEKPMALNQTELDALVEVLNETQVPFLMGFNRRFSPAARRAKEIIGERQNPLMIFYRMNAGYLPPDHWTQGEEGGGRIIGEGCHIFDLFRFLVNSPVAEVKFTPIAPKTDLILSGDNVTITLRYEDGSVATLFYTALGAPAFSKEYMELYADGKVLVLDDYRELRVYGTPQKGWISKVQQKGHIDELKSFATNILKGETGPVPLFELVETTETSFLVGSQT
jgi:predicted dehydrogenase/threonine dehydrogenase-like Zn-dependent dehydrogenase